MCSILLRLVPKKGFLMKAKGFVSCVYVFYNLVTAVVFGAFIFACLFSKETCVPAILFALVGFAFYFIGNCLRAPIACKRFFINSEGIGYGKAFIKHEDIERVVICRGYVEKWFGFRFVENLSGIEQHDEIYAGDMICINCDFRGFRGKKNKNAVYIPRNKNTDSIMRKYCTAYASQFPEIKDETQEKIEKNSRKTLWRIVRVSLIYLVLSIIIILLAGNGVIGICKAAFITLFLFLWGFLAAFEEQISDFIFQKWL